MAEALVAVGLASNIIQFIDFGSRFVSSAWRIYQTGESKGELPHETINDLRTLLAQLRSSQTEAGQSNEDEAGLQKLVGSCQRLADELLSSLQKVNLPAKARKRDALKTAFKTMFKEDEIKSLQAKLDEFRQQLMLHLLSLIRRQGQQSVDQQQEILNSLNALHKDRSLDKDFEHGIGTLLLSTLASSAKPSTLGDTAGKLQADLIAAIYHDTQGKNPAEAQHLPIPEKRRKMLERIFLGRLRYRGMEDRKERIAEAYANTFQWIFEPSTSQRCPRSNFRDWLESDSELYWITGKAGSGKSTLMKYICQTDTPTDGTLMGPDRVSDEFDLGSRCAKHLREWAGSSDFITVTFFFWSSGVQYQMTQDGLLRTLLYQILQKLPHLVPNVAPKRWEALCLFDDDSQEWTEQELQRALRVAVHEANKTTRLCFFVDGLDEFEGPHQDLIALFKDLIRNSNVKACVSSRPWVIFEDAFKQGPSVMLQELTYADIKHYVTENLQGDSGFAQLRRREPQYADDLIENVVSKASGVFLWVHLVVASLLAGMEYGDRVSDLKRRLDLLPSDLEELYDKILRSLDPFYLEHAAQLFKLVQVCYDPPPLLSLYFADEDDVHTTIQRNIEPMAEEEILFREDVMQRRLNSRCKGFLEVGPAIYVGVGPNNVKTVQYSHATVKDYMQSRVAQKMLAEALDASFDAHLKLCTSNLAYLKATASDSRFLDFDMFWSRICCCLYSAARIQSCNCVYMIALLDDLEKTVVSLQKSKAPVMSEWSDSEYFSTMMFWLYGLSDLSFPGIYLSLVVQFGVTEYVKAKVNHGCYVQGSKDSKWPLLFDAINVRVQGIIGHAVPQLGMVECLLSNGADPNAIFALPPERVRSVWDQVVRNLAENWGSQSPWLKISELMIQHGAHLDRATIYRLCSDGTSTSHKGKAMKRVNLLRRPSKAPLETPLAVEVFETLLAMKRRNRKRWPSWLSRK